MPADLFIDTNILVYAHDRDAGAKHDRAKALIEKAWREPSPPCLSVQVLQELFVNLHRNGVSIEDARATVADYAQWRVADNTVALLEDAVREMKRWRLSFWDSLVLAAARSLHTTTVWSEDLSDGQDYGGIRVVNPLL